MFPQRLLILCLLVLSLQNTESANWAQASGYLEQNVVIPAIPSSTRKHWQARYGLASLVFPNSSTPSGNLYLFGGDTYSNDDQRSNMLPGVLDEKWGSGYKNDVWSMEGTQWYAHADSRLKGRNNQKLPVVQSQMRWALKSSGLSPPIGLSYDDWIICQDYFKSKSKYTSKRATLCTSSYEAQWSPRRHHRAIYFQNEMWIMGGRAREFLEYEESRTVGGIIGPRVADAKTASQYFRTQREASVYKSDVWKSTDGLTWTLVTPGCKAPQKSLIARGNSVSQVYGRNACSTTDDCYGAETCDDDYKTCVCSMWTSREQFGLSSHNDYLYLSGGYTSILISDITSCGDRPCGDTDAGSYRHYLSDVWRSADGLTWELLTESAFRGFGRGGHEMLTISDLQTGIGYLWVFGGRGYFSDTINSGNTIKTANNNNQLTEEDYIRERQNLIWIAEISSTTGTIGEWYSLTNSSSTSSTTSKNLPWFVSHIPWSSRTGLNVVLQQASPANYQTRMLYVIGGQQNPQINNVTASSAAADAVSTSGSSSNTQQQQQQFAGSNYNNRINLNRNHTFLSDIWSWRLDLSLSSSTDSSGTSDGSDSEPWRQDDSEDELFLSSGYEYRNHSPATTYITPDSRLEDLIKWWTPDRLHREPRRSRLVEITYITPAHLEMLNILNIFTIRDLATADKYTILKLRGFDIPQIPKKDRFTFDKVCDVRSLAQAIVEKCTVNLDRFIYDGQKNLPRYVYPSFKGKVPAKDNIEWHGQDKYNVYISSADDPVTLVSTWDGCTYINLTKDAAQAIHGPNVPGIGYVSLPSSVKDPLREVENLFCRWNPGPRAYAEAAMLEDRLYVFGGKTSEIDFKADTWYREPVLPKATFDRKPKSKSSDITFKFSANKAGCYFEYRLWNPQKYKEIVPWTSVVSDTDVSWLDWRKSGPGDGWYTLYVRAIDPAGNTDPEYIINENVHNWYYVSPPPYDIIFGCIGAFLFICLVAFIEYRRRVKKAAMERYAMKRMRRKFKAMRKELDGRDVDWRKLYLESKQTDGAAVTGGTGGGGGGGNNNNGENDGDNGSNKSSPTRKNNLRERKLEKREKDKKKKDAEKEKIKNKLNAARIFKESQFKAARNRANGNNNDDDSNDGNETDISVSPQRSPTNNQRNNNNRSSMSKSKNRGSAQNNNNNNESDGDNDEDDVVMRDLWRRKKKPSNNNSRSPSRNRSRSGSPNRIVPLVSEDESAGGDGDDTDNDTLLNSAAGNRYKDYKVREQTAKKNR